MDTHDRDPQLPSEPNGHFPRKILTRLPAALLGATIAVVQTFLSVILCTFGAGAVALDKEGARLGVPIAIFGIVIGGVIGYLAAPRNWTVVNTVKFVAFMLGSVLATSLATFLGLILFEVVADALWGNAP